MIYLAGIVITFFLAVLLAGKRNKTAADRILIVWLCGIGFHLLLYYLFIEGKIYDYPYLLGIHLPYPLIHGPFLFLYTAQLTNRLSKKKWTSLLHFLPLIAIYFYMAPFFGLSSNEKIAVYQNNGAGYEGLMKFLTIAIIISGIVYITTSLFLLRRYRKSIVNEFSNIEKINLAWLRYFIYGTAVIWTAVIIGNDKLVFGTVVLFVFLLGYFGIRQVGIFTTSTLQNTKLSIATTEEVKTEPIERKKLPIDTRNEPAGIVAAPKIKYERSGLDEVKAGDIYKRLVGCMTEEKIFTDSEITLAGLAKTLNVHPNHLSQVINSYEGKNFYDYINFYRVEEFKRLASSPDNKNYTLLSLAYECGFNSKTSFNRNFKKVAGVSPTAWLHQLNITLK